jgi:tetratricopeptide (TPR) repeat protein
MSGDARLDRWRAGLAELLMASLSQSKFIRVVPGDEMFTILKRLGMADARKYSSEDIKKIAAQSRATHVLSGSFITAGDIFVITAGLQKPATSESPMTVLLEARGENDIILKVDELTRRVMAGLNFTEAQIAGDLEKEAGQITTSSPEALKYYVEGQNHANRYESSQARECFEKAVEIDVEFAMAYLALSHFYDDRRDIAEARRYLEKARGLSGRLPENERLLIEAQALSWSRDYPKAIAAFEKLLRIYPGNIAGHQLLALAYDSVGDIDRFIEQYEFLLQHKRTAAVVWGLGFYYMLKGLYQKAEETCLSFIKEVEDNARVRLSLGMNYLCRRQFDRALAEVEKAYLLNPQLTGGHANTGWILICKDDLVNAEKVCEQDTEPSWYLWHIALVRGKYSEAIKLARRDFEEGEWDLNVRTNVYGALPFILEKAGCFKEALESIDLAQKAAVKSQEPWLLGLLSVGTTSLIIKAKIQAEMGSYDEAQKTAYGLKALIEKGANPTELRWYDYLIGMVELGRKNYPKAIRHLNKAAESLYFETGICHDPHALLFDALARAFYESGDLDRARGQYEMITLLTSGRLNHGDIYAKAFYMLGKIAGQTGDKVKAREHFRKFLSLWKDADPGLPEVEDAGRRLAGLGGI